MKLAVVGLGSMGKRRLRNLSAIGERDLAGFDPRADRRAEVGERHGIPTFDDFGRLMVWGPDALVISTPPDLHMTYALRAVEAGVPFFTEAGVPDERLPSLIGQLRAKGVVGVPSCTMRFYPGPKRLKSVIASGKIGRPLVWTHHSGQYLPDWHPWETPETFYVSKRDTGGCREIVAFELVWLTDVLGPVCSVSGQNAKISDLALDIDDVYQLQVRHESGAMGQLTVDVLARAPVRHCRVIGSEGTVEWDFTSKAIRLYTAGAGTWVQEALSTGTVEAGYVNPEEPYIEEMRAFVRAARREAPPIYTYEEDLAVLRVLLAAEESSRDAVRKAVAENKAGVQ